MSRMLLIIPYFGSWPFWLDFFLLSCRRNPTVNWLIIGDSPAPADAPANVEFRQVAYADYLAFVSARLGIPFDPVRPYKLCDLKPMYGYLHEEDLSGYDFWGFCDLDVVFGDLRSFLTPEVLRHDVIATHDTRISGHFSLLRNTPVLREAFRRIPDWAAKVCEQKSQRLDEAAFSKLFLRYKRWPQGLRKWLPGANPLGVSTLFREQFSTPDCRIAWVDGSRDFPSEWYWRDGVLSNDRSERSFMYFHFLYWKQNHWKREYKTEGGHLARGEAQCFVPGPDCRFFRVTREGFHAD
nr:DUF6625 family protein [Pseudomonas oryzae]